MVARAVIKQERIPFDVESEKQAKLQRAWEAIERMRDNLLKVDVKTRGTLEDVMLDIRKDMLEEMEKANR